MGMGFAPTEEPAPPGRHSAYAGCHWLQRIDYDGRPCGLEVYQWQPNAKRWCRPNEYAQDRNVSLQGYEYVAACPTPAFPDELKAVERAMEFLKGTSFAEEADYQTVKRLVGEHLFTTPKKA